jgi:hypothetical protein
VRDLIGTQRYNVFVDYQYSIYVSTNQDPVTWVSTFGRFSFLNTYNAPSYTIYPVTSTRIGDRQYSEVHVRQMLTPGENSALVSVDILDEPNIANSNFYTTIRLQSSITATGSGEIFVDIFSPGANNYTFTLVPR